LQFPEVSARLDVFLTLLRKMLQAFFCSFVMSVVFVIYFWDCCESFWMTLPVLPLMLSDLHVRFRYTSMNLYLFMYECICSVLSSGLMLYQWYSESLPENIAGWRPWCGWLGHSWVCLAADCGVQSPFIQAMSCCYLHCAT